MPLDRLSSRGGCPAMRASADERRRQLRHDRREHHAGDTLAGRRRA
ncbi:MAG: hypothetical protein ACLR4Z_01585 [Butyricicoccaceae bacterium]